MNSPFINTGLPLLFWVLTVAAGYALPSLPEGDNGIAVRYPGDAGIAADRAVVFTENFEEVTGSSLSESNCAFDAVYGPNLITREAGEVNSGSQAVRTTHTNPVSFGGVKFLGGVSDTLFLRYYLKYHAAFPGCHHTGGGIYAASGSAYTQLGHITGVRPDGTNNFQAHLDNLSPLFSWSPPGNETSPGWLHVYCYNMDQADVYGDHFFPDGMILPGASGADFGNDFVPRTNYLPERDRWYCFEIMLQANTPGRADGRVAFWVDGQLEADFPGLRLRSVNSLKPNHVAISTYSSAVHPDKTMWYDDVVAATAYIGPLYTGTPAGPALNRQENRRPGAEATAWFLDVKGRIRYRQSFSWSDGITLSALGPDLPTGVYLVRVAAGAQPMVFRKMIIKK